LSVLEQKTFIAAIPPFDRLLEADLERMVQSVDIAYFKTGEYLIPAGRVPEHLFIVIKGLVHELSDEEKVSVYTQQDSFNPLALIENSNSNAFVAQEETICYLVPKVVFLNILNRNKSFENFYYQDLTARLNDLIEQRNSKEVASFMVARIEDAYIQPPVFVDAQVSIAEAVKLMREQKVMALLIKRDQEVGIMTDTDVSNHVVLKRVPIDAAVGDIATYRLIGAKIDDFLFNANLLMTRNSIKHLIIYDKENQIAGILDQVDLLSYFSTHSHLIAVQIERATTTEQLKKASQTLVNMIQSLYSRGVKVRFISQLVGDLNKKIFEKLYQLIAPPELLANSCLLVMGSEGREEQILKTDQDNAIILRDGFEYPDLPKLTQTLTEILIDFGYPPCPGNIMVSNPFWCKSLKSFQNQVYDWVDQPNEEALMNLAIFYDAQAIAGDASLLAAVKNYLYKLLNDNLIFFGSFARPTLAFETPLSWFEGFIVEKNEHKDELNMKKGGIFPIVHGVRSLALEHRLTCTNTIERIKVLRDKGVLDKDFAVELVEAFAFMISIRLDAELKKVNLNQDYDNYIKPDALNKLERDLLKDSFKIVNEFKKFITHHFRLNMVS
jgi:CBS domain-containing protein